MNKSHLTIGIAALVVLCLIFLGMDFREKPDAGAYQAVFLENGQLYFGKLEMKKRQYILRETYYLQRSVADVQKSADADNSNIKLIKLGSELHEPKDTLYIEPSKVLVWENLQQTGRVVEAINKFKSAPSPAATPEPPPAN